MNLTWTCDLTLLLQYYKVKKWKKKSDDLQKVRKKRKKGRKKGRAFGDSTSWDPCSLLMNALMA